MTAPLSSGAAWLDGKAPASAVTSGEERRRALGLSSVHISSPQATGSVRLFVNGALVKLKGDPGRAPEQGPRGWVTGFSRASRKRMLEFVQSVDQVRAGMPLFVTLTYPGEWPGDPHRWKRDLDTWLQRLRRAAADAWAVWRLEPQRRGAPHYHLLVFGIDRLDKDWLGQSWFEVVGSGDLRHLRAGTQVQRTRSWRGVVRYAAKYLAKTMEELPEGWADGVGRWWGVHNRRAVVRQPVDAALGAHEFYLVKRVLRRILSKRGVDLRRVTRDKLRACGQVVRAGISAFLSAESAVGLLAWAAREAGEQRAAATRGLVRSRLVGGRR